MRFGIRTTDEIGFSATGRVGNFGGKAFDGFGSFASGFFDGGCGLFEIFGNCGYGLAGFLGGRFLARHGFRWGIILTEISSFRLTFLHKTIITLMVKNRQVLLDKSIEVC